ncbi:hypothetical protein ONS95_001839 [Cadophora gregata]|uniref:uncharacterized protein n=1 Tax=Cadophora gregata TaxID=51156 RepID=UPI0026DB2288|nr:uncharacterized protein ONS95_001839 [Cadophora gregata]KAK0111484.1 hypothetical protein ONS95_001839 [Cadophora gregata]KAK0112040.1 hypothetical protein ONS96_001301 [Cadophora gregata f. sp. sojae]
MSLRSSSASSLSESNSMAEPQIPSSQGDWERHRLLIKQYYMDEGKTLNEVINAMRNHGFKATAKMYKSRLKRWGLEKKHKESDMVVILHKKNQRDAIGKKSSFQLRGRDLNMEEVFLYFTRKGRGLPKIKIPVTVSTPPEISYWTPSPTNSTVSTPRNTPGSSLDSGNRSSTPGSRSSDNPSFDTPETNEDETDRSRSSEASSTGDISLSRTLSSDSSDGVMVSTIWTPASPLMDHEFVIQLHSEDIDSFFSKRSGISHSPSLPRSLHISENMFYSIKAYFEHSCRNLILDENGTLLTPNGAKMSNDLCNDFDSYCFSATMFLEQGLYVESRRALSKASALVEPILQAEHPRTFACFLEVLIHLLQTGYPEVANIMRTFIQGMSARVTQPHQPWGRICHLLGAIDSDCLEEAMGQLWKCSSDTFETELGTFNRLAVSVRLDYIKRVFGNTNHLEEERLLRDLLAQSGNSFEGYTPRVMLNLAHNLNRQGRYNESEEIGQHVLLLIRDNEARGQFIVEKVDSLKLISRSQHSQKNALAAEMTLRQAISIIVGEWGLKHSWVPEFMLVLEGWLRGWGREDDANVVRAKIDTLMGRDEIDEELLVGG